MVVWVQAGKAEPAAGLVAAGDAAAAGAAAMLQD